MPTSASARRGRDRRRRQPRQRQRQPRAMRRRHVRLSAPAAKGPRRGQIDAFAALEHPAAAGMSAQRIARSFGAATRRVRQPRDVDAGRARRSHPRLAPTGAAAIAARLRSPPAGRREVSPPGASGPAPASAPTGPRRRTTASLQPPPSRRSCRHCSRARRCRARSVANRRQERRLLHRHVGAAAGIVTVPQGAINPIGVGVERAPTRRLLSHPSCDQSQTNRCHVRCRILTPTTSPNRPVTTVSVDPE
jgi:hypothetical protein